MFVVGLAMAAAGGSDPLGVHGVIVLHVGDEVSVDADPISTVRTSMTFRVEAWRRSRDGDEQIKVTEAVFTSVVIDSGSHPRPMLPGWVRRPFTG